MKQLHAMRIVSREEVDEATQRGEDLPALVIAEVRERIQRDLLESHEIRMQSRYDEASMSYHFEAATHAFGFEQQRALGIFMRRMEYSTRVGGAGEDAASIDMATAAARRLYEALTGTFTELPVMRTGLEGKEE